MEKSKPCTDDVKKSDLIPTVSIPENVYQEMVAEKVMSDIIGQMYPKFTKRAKRVIMNNDKNRNHLNVAYNAIVIAGNTWEDHKTFQDAIMAGANKIFKDLSDLGGEDGKEIGTTHN